MKNQFFAREKWRFRNCGSTFREQFWQDEQADWQNHHAWSDVLFQLHKEVARLQRECGNPKWTICDRLRKIFDLGVASVFQKGTEANSQKREVLGITKLLWAQNGHKMGTIWARNGHGIGTEWARKFLAQNDRLQVS